MTPEMNHRGQPFSAHITRFSRHNDREGQERISALRRSLPDGQSIPSRMPHLGRLPESWEDVGWRGYERRAGPKAGWTGQRSLANTAGPATQVGLDRGVTTRLFRDGYGTGANSDKFKALERFAHVSSMATNCRLPFSSR